MAFNRSGRKPPLATDRIRHQADLIDPHGRRTAGHDFQRGVGGLFLRLEHQRKLGPVFHRRRKRVLRQHIAVAHEADRNAAGRFAAHHSEPRSTSPRCTDKVILRDARSAAAGDLERDFAVQRLVGIERQFSAAQALSSGGRARAGNRTGRVWSSADGADGAEFSGRRAGADKRLTVVGARFCLDVEHRLVVDEGLHLAAVDAHVDAIPAPVLQGEIRGAHSGLLVALRGWSSDQLHLFAFEAERRCRCRATRARRPAMRPVTAGLADVDKEVVVAPGFRRRSGSGIRGRVAGGLTSTPPRMRQSSGLKRSSKLRFHTTSPQTPPLTEW